MNQVKLGGELVTPSKIVCVGRNYVAHIHELNNEVPEEMVVFIKPNSSITDQLVARHGEVLHYEAEICYLIKDGKFASVGCGLDLTKRGLQSTLKQKGLPWERAKAFDGSALFSSFVPLDDIDTDLELELLVNGSRRQQGSTSLMIYKPAEILAELKTFLTLENGDIVMTGTPSGVGPVLAGEQYCCRLLSAGKMLTSCDWLAT